MKVKKINETMSRGDLEIVDITLLSEGEYNKLKTNIPYHVHDWWLRTAGLKRTYWGAEVAYVKSYSDNSYANYCFVDSTKGVRPVLHVKNVASANLKKKDQILLGGSTWTVISSNLIICDCFIRSMKFREDWKVEDANHYEKSDVRKFLQQWSKENEIRCLSPESGISENNSAEIVEKKNVKTIIKTTSTINPYIEDVTLLSKEEYEATKIHIPYRKTWWWLRSPGLDNKGKVAVVMKNGLVGYRTVMDDVIGIRPVLKITEMNPDILEVDDKIILWGHTWTVISPKLVLCDDIVDYTLFRYTIFRENSPIFEENWRNQDVCNYDKSDVKIWIKEWKMERWRQQNNK